MKLLLATRNEHKRREFARLLAHHEIALLADGVELPPEDGHTFAQNAFGKARAAAAATGEAAIADDSGIEAEALGGAPGVRSARYAGEHATDEENLDKLLREVPAGGALAYVCALAYVDPSVGVERVFEGRCTGRLAAEPQGAGGFGYDPAFLPDDTPPRDDDTPPGDGSTPPHDDDTPPGDGSTPPHDDDTPPGDGSTRAHAMTMAELTDEQKDAISHRGRAARALEEWLGPKT